MGAMKSYTIATLGSHSALQILRGARAEGFATLAICNERSAALYRRYPFVDDIMVLPTYQALVERQEGLDGANTILVPHGSFVAHLGVERTKQVRIPYFGNKQVLDWETDRHAQRIWLERAGLRMPREMRSADEIDCPVIVKLHGARGGSGYFFARDAAEFVARTAAMARGSFTVQEALIGAPVYLHYFYSLLEARLEFLGADIRYETNVDSLGRLPSEHQIGLPIEPTFVVVGNLPLGVRESMLHKVYHLGESVVAVSRLICPPRGLFGAFCLEGIITPDEEFSVFEISARIVAGTNVALPSSPYADLYFGEPMSTGRRIARELRTAILSGRLAELVE
ncbi:MAG TPA: formate--phosphoribosylaminoimidazolecarboxamide ligase [Chloroflexota bacterium]|nr:formate--phosphoribosylaminoimidazolecarboxamide ligase [Chloroflexota bacterium]